ncbi:MAG: hypothetical protein ACLQO7_02955 [Candidatus Bathyarchaeia archaeon]
MKKKEAIIALALLIILSVLVAFLGFIIDFSTGGTGPGYGGDEFDMYSEPFHTTNSTTVHISMGYTPARGMVLYCTYIVTNSDHKVVDSSVMTHIPFSSEYIIDKTLTNLSNGNYAFTITDHYADGSIRTPENETFTIDTSFKYPMLTIISPENQTYNTNKINITYYTNSKIIYSYYKLNGGNWTWFQGNTTIDGLSNGSYNLGVFVVTEANQHIDHANEAGSANFTVNST